MYLLKEGQTKRLLNVIDNQKHKLILLFMLDCGLKVSQCISLKISSFDFGKRIIKTGIPVKIPDRCYELLSNYISSIKNLNYESFLFPASASKMRNNSNRKHICRKSINKFLERLAKKYPEFHGIHPKALQLARPECSIANEDSLLNKALGRFKNAFGFKKRRHEIFHFVQDDKGENDSSYDKSKTFGRKDELKKIQKFLEKKINVMLLGGVGVGKSHLINCLVNQFKSKILRLDDCYEIKKSLINILLFLYKNDKDTLKNELYPDYNYDALLNHLQRDSMSNLCKEIIKITAKNEYLLVIDSCDRITPRGVKILEELKDHFSILSSAREIPINKSSFLWNFEIVRMKNLERRFALGMIMHLSRNMDIEDVSLFRNHIFEQSVGNPRVIMELIERYKKEVVVTPDIVREVRHTGSLKEYDCSLFIILFFGFLSCLRFMSHELGNDSLRFIGGCSVLLMLLIRNVLSKRKKF